LFIQLGANIESDRDDGTTTDRVLASGSFSLRSRPVYWTGLLDEISAPLPQSSGRPVKFCGYEDIGRAELFFDDPFDPGTEKYSHRHFIWVAPEFIRQYRGTRNPTKRRTTRAFGQRAGRRRKRGKSIVFPIHQHLTAPVPSAVVGCTSATKADRELLLDVDARERHVWSCSMMRSRPRLGNPIARDRLGDLNH
jgi:hypothetical protein